jgi:transcriptional regulator with XRE-family HTH domain
MKRAITPAQGRAARALVNWSRDRLAKESGVPSRTIADFELANTSARDTTLAAICSALEAAGVEFTNGDAPGVRLRKG